MKFTPFRISLIYLVFAILWITTTDQLLDYLISDSEMLSQFQTAKGLFYISLTALGLYFMMKSYEGYIAKSKHELEKYEKSLSLALDSAKMGTWDYIVATDTYTISKNHNQLFGYGQNIELKLSHVYDRLHPDDVEKFNEKRIKTIEDGDDFELQYRVIFENGEQHWLWTKGEAHLKKGKVVSVNGVTIDITESKELQAELALEQELQTNILENIPVMITVFRPDISDFKVNAEFEKISGWTNKELHEIDLIKETYPDIEIRDQVEQFMRLPGTGWKDFQITTKSGEKIETSWTNIQISNNTRIGIGIDISERKRLENHVDAERKKLQKIFDSMPVFVNLHDDNSGIAEVNKYFEEKLGYSNETIKKSDLLKLITSEEGYLKARKEINKSDGKWTDFELFSKNGERILTTWTNIKISEESSLGIGLDITERKLMEEKLRENEEWLQLTTDSANIGKWEWDPTTGDVKFDEIWAKLVGYTLDELQPISIETWNRLLHPEDHKKFEKAYQDYVNGIKPIYECEVRMHHKDGHWVWILDRGKAIEWNEDNTPVRLFGTHIDISERIAFEESVRYQASLLANVSDAVISVDKDFVITSWNHAAEEIYGWTAKEVIGKSIEEFFETKYESGITDEIAFKELIEKGNWQGEVLQKTKNGGEKMIFSSVTVVRGADGAFSDIISVNRNITERKQYEKENRLLANVFIRSNTALAVTNQKTNQLERVNQACADLFGYSMEEMIGLDVHNLYPDQFKEDADQQFEALKRLGVNSFESEFKRKDGSSFNGLINLSMVKENEDGDPYRIATVQDISELKKIQDQLLKERHRFEVAANNVSDVVWEWNPVTEEIWWNEGIETVLEYKKEDYEGDVLFWHNHLYEEDKAAAVKSMEHAELTGETEWEYEYRFYDALGNVRSIKDSAVLIRDENGELLRVIGAMLDVTQVLEYQKALQVERNKFELIAKSSNDVLYDYNVKTDEVWWSEGWITRFGFKEEDLDGRLNWWSEKIHPEDKERVEKSLATAVKSEKDYWVEQYRFLNGSKDYRNVIDKGYFLRDEHGEIVQMVGTISDITIDIQARENLKASEEQYRLLFKQSPLPMYIYDPNTLGIVAVNNSVIEKYGYTEDELKEMKIYDLHPESEHKAFKKEIAENLKHKRTGFDIWNQITKTGEIIIAEISGSEIYYNGKIHRLVVTNDITAQKKAEERAISAIIEGEERERQRIAKELHDGLGQYLSAANMNLETVYEDSKGLPDSLSKTFKNGLQLLNHAISETRNISQNLLPKAIQDYGLELALESLINQLKVNNRIQFYLYQKLDGLIIPDNIQINLYRIAQEALNNALKHANPDNVNVQLVYTGVELLLTIEDDGDGFIVEDKIGVGIGLQSIKTRVGAMSANLDIVSTKGRGTIISVVVPL